MAAKKESKPRSPRKTTAKKEPETPKSDSSTRAENPFDQPGDHDGIVQRGR